MYIVFVELDPSYIIQLLSNILLSINVVMDGKELPTTDELHKIIILNL